MRRSDCAGCVVETLQNKQRNVRTAGEEASHKGEGSDSTRREIFQQCKRQSHDKDINGENGNQPKMADACIHVHVRV